MQALLPLILFPVILAVLLVGVGAFFGRPSNHYRTKIPVWCPNCSPGLRDIEHGITGRVDAKIVRNSKKLKKVTCTKCGKRIV